MRSLLRKYERHLQHMAEDKPRLRGVEAFYQAAFPWIAVVLLFSGAATILQVPRPVEMAIVLPTVFLAAAGAGYAAWRVSAYGWRYDRTPSAAAWAETPDGKALIGALRRVTLNALSGVTPATRLQADLRLTPSDVSELLSILQAEGRLPTRRLDGVELSSLTIQELLDRMPTG